MHDAKPIKDQSNSDVKQIFLLHSVASYKNKIRYIESMKLAIVKDDIFYYLLPWYPSALLDLDLQVNAVYVWKMKR